MSIRELTQVRLKAPRWGNYARWTTQPRRWVRHRWEYPQGIIRKVDMKLRRPIRLYVDPIAARKNGYWLYQNRFFETSENNLSEWKFVELVTELDSQHTA